MRSPLDLGPRARVLFAVCFLAVEVTILASAPWRPDRSFGFQMFNGSSDISFTLSRRVRDRHGALVEVAAPRGEWTAADSGGKRRRFRWAWYVRGTRLTRPDVRRHAKDGLDAQVFHLQHALDHVAARLRPDDAETVALVARVRGVRNGRETVDLVLEGAVR